MSDLLTAKDVEIKVFKKVKFGGYSVPEVEDFLNQVADDLEAYAIQLDEKDNRIQELEAFVKKQESMTDAIKDALIQARKAAQDIEDEARANAEKIIAEAHEKSEKQISESEGKFREQVDEAERKAAEIIAKARNSADEIIKNSQDKRAQAEQSRASIEQELEAQRREAHEKADEIIADAKAQARNLMSDTQDMLTEQEKQIRFLSLQKQNFVKNTMSLLLDFGKIIDRAQQDIDAQMESIPPEEEIPQDSDEVMNEQN
ncbi:MAG: DivIVA domain-containing protein [Synergistaceae bacterium]|nr:DivIVA domain-containing protein [Synergistaceae bacterium]MBR0074156.1 DivIVA domain-containing protein [Synergistaceae bacterium]MBR0080599.1 DivIVA domain-containing protein [Synergistaceae bacterium]MBR0234721.1 DivIVA domain-containing protein [Synergistaceae bacterium]MBR0254278.1 DivIVA domain-containing protein [Synergistaceae bacterium]